MSTRSLLFSILTLSTIVLASFSSRAAEVTTIYSPDSRLPAAAVDLVDTSSGTLQISANYLTDPRVIGSLCAASTRGQTVAAVLNLTSGTSCKLAAQQLAAAGVTVFSSTMANTFGNHLLAVTPGTVAIGNYYWSPTALQIGNFLSIVADQSITTQYQNQFALLASGGTLIGGPERSFTARPLPSAPLPPLVAPACGSCCPCRGSCPAAAAAPAGLWFSPNGGAKLAIQTAIAGAKSSILVLTYTDTNVGIFQSLAAAARRGVRVQIVADEYCAALPKSQIPAVAAAGVPVRLDSAEKIMHEKVMIVDGTTVFTGSFNFSEPAENANAEDLIRIDDAGTAAAFSAEWQKHWDHSNAFHAPAHAAAAPRQPFSPSTHRTGPVRRLIAAIRSRKGR